MDQDNFERYKDQYEGPINLLCQNKYATNIGPPNQVLVCQSFGPPVGSLSSPR